MLEWLHEHREALSWGIGISAAALVCTFPIAAFVTVRLPADYFSRHTSKPAQGRANAGTVFRNVLGAVVVLGGIAMLALPGPGFLVLLMGLAVMDFPGKHRIVRWIMDRKNVIRAANSLRRWFGTAPLIRPK